MGNYQITQTATAELTDKLPEQRQLIVDQQNLVKLRSQFRDTVGQNVINHMAINFVSECPMKLMYS